MSLPTLRGPGIGLGIVGFRRVGSGILYLGCLWGSSNDATIARIGSPVSVRPAAIPCIS